MSDPKKYMNHTISLTSDWTFEVEGPEFDASRYKMTFQSVQAAEDEISKRVADANKLAAQNVKIDLRLLGEDGTAVVVTRINRTDGDLVGVKGRYVYPHTQFVRNLLLKALQLKQELRAVDDQLTTVRISVGRGYGRIKAEDYLGTVKSLQRDYDAALEKAKALAEPTPPVLSVVSEANAK